MPSDSDPPRSPAPQVWPVLRARDAATLMTFLVDVLGFVESVAYRDGDTIHHAELAWPLGGALMLGSAPTGEVDHPSKAPGSFSAYVVSDEVDAIYARALRAGAASVLAPYDTDYGSHECAIADPEGNHWSFGTYRGHALS